MSDKKEIHFPLDLENKFINDLEWFIKLNFPKIENLNIAADAGTKLKITFNEGPYTKKEVEKKLDEIKSYKPIFKDIKFPDNL